MNVPVSARMFVCVYSVLQKKVHIPFLQVCLVRQRPLRFPVKKTERQQAQVKNTIVACPTSDVARNWSGIMQLSRISTMISL